MKTGIITLITTLAVLLSSQQLNAQSLSNSVFLKHKKEAEHAVERGLDYLVSKQQNDGAFGGGYDSSTGIVALAGMAFLSLPDFR